MLEGCAQGLKRAFLAAEGTRPSAFRTGLLLAQAVGLLFEKGLQSSLGKTGGGGDGDLLHGREIDVESGSVLAEGASSDDFAPLGGKAAEFLDVVGSKGAACHDASCVGVNTNTKEKLAPLGYDEALDTAKRFMTSSVIPRFAVRL